MRKYHIKGKLPGANEYILANRTNRYTGAKMKEEMERLIIMQIRDHEPVKGAVIVHFTWHEKTRRRDKDNVAFAKKFVLDAFQKIGILPNDNNNYVAGFTDIFEYGGEYGVTVEIEEKYVGKRDKKEPE